MLIPSAVVAVIALLASLSRRVNANSQQLLADSQFPYKLIKKGEC